mgnify:CR=1 FL=1|jgi:hypothetical protein
MDEFQIDILIDVLPLDDIQGRRGANLPSIWMLSIPYELPIEEVQVRFSEPPL